MTFDRFWATYPRRVGKGAALKSWEKLNPDDNLTQEILLAIQAQIRWKHEAKKTFDLQVAVTCGKKKKAPRITQGFQNR